MLWAVRSGLVRSGLFRWIVTPYMYFDYIRELSLLVDLSIEAKEKKKKKFGKQTQAYKITPKITKN